MLRIFRQLRKALMEKNKTRSYIYYAIGEILLVMIGILLALQVNNWNENRRIVTEETRLLNQLSTEIINAIVSRETIIKNYNERRSLIAASLVVIQNPVGVNTLEAELCSSLAASHVLVFTPTKVSTVDELITNGSIANIRDDYLRNK